MARQHTGCKYLCALLSFFAITFLTPQFAVAQEQSATVGNEAIAGAALSPKIMELRRAGAEAMFNIDYASAVVKFEEILKLAPEHPAGDLYLATALWLKNLNQNRRLQTGLYKSGSNFYAGASKEENEGDEVDPSVDRAFRDRMARAKTKALALVAKNKNDVDAIYFLGATYGVLAGYEATTARKFFSALRNGSRCVDAHEKVIKLRPNYYDAFLSIGLYDYVAGSLPFGYKALGLLAGVRGNKARGIERLQTIVAKNASTADDARVLLLPIYQNEKRFPEALATLEQLNAKYPNNYLLKLETASMLVTLKRSTEAYDAFEALLKDPAAAHVIDLVNYQYAEALFAEKEYKRAATLFIAVSQIQGADSNLTTLSLLRSAQLFDLIGDRPGAIAQYKAVLARPNVYDTRSQAEKGLNKPFIEQEKKGD